ncbi:alkaline phosphatase [Balneicella halophila]|uniref:Alkaline phosphatase n=1 Tax=Balneicella halophila TaxID=1537566 RepID=A0A7L4USP6_BALHA|nr:alkaline phosphatase [Balneicella halophila]PVX52471.1 alkaline phosphatase [Balneicella halophila]
MKKYLYLIAGLFLWASCVVAVNNKSGLSGSTSANNKKAEAKRQKAPKYVFYFIGDGYGPAQAHLAEEYLANRDGRILPDTLLMNTFPVHGTYTTYAGNRFITGSAAAGTALAAGHKTTINTICMSGDHGLKYKSMAELLRSRGMKIGIVTSVSIDHATPAVFYAHQPNRNNYYDIALELAESDFNYFAGGGFKDPEGVKKGNKNPLANMGIDKSTATSANKYPSAYAIAEQAGYRFVNSKSEFAQLKKGDDKIVVFDPKPASGASIPYVIDQTDENFTLVDFTKKGIELLDNPNGFFMMVEGGKIDWACHANDAATAALEVLQFDDAVREAYNFYLKHPNETLIVICSDHETGGLTLGHAATHYETSYQYLNNQKCSTEAFTEMIEDYKAKHPNNARYEDIYPLLKEYFGFDTTDELKLDQYDIADLKKALQDDVTTTYEERMHNPRLECGYGPYNPLATVAARILANKAGLSWTTYSHTAIPCPARAVGVGAEAFYGYYDNTELPRKILKMYELL